MNIDIKNLYSVLSQRKQFIIALMALSFIWPLQFISTLHFHSELTSVDASWMLTLSNAWDQQQVWGEDIIFTYGPLSFLSTRVILSNSIWVLAVFDLYVACSFVFIIHKIIASDFSWKKSTLILLACFFYKQAMLLSLVFTLQFIAILYLNAYRHERKYTYILQAIILTTLIFYIKLNLAFAAVVIFVLYIFYLKAVNVISWKAVAASIFAFALIIFSSSLLLPVNLGNYISTGISLIVSYGDAVYMYPRTMHEKILTAMIAILFFLSLSYILKELKNRVSAQSILCVIFVLLLFIIFKQSYVRADLEHIKDFFYCTPVCFLIFLYVRDERPQYIHLPVALCWIIALGLFFRFQDYLYPIKKIVAFPAYCYSVFNQPDYYEQNHLRALPVDIKETINKCTIDIIPWESSLLILNRLIYHPRPVIQSYQAYNETLDKVNAQYYSSCNAPEFALYSLNSIDHHYHFFDDTHLKKELYTNYYIVDTFTSQKEKIILFKRAHIKQQKEFRKIASGKSSISDSIIVPPSVYPLLVKLKMKCNLMGQIQKAVLRTPSLEIEMTLQDSSVVCFQAATSILEGGVFIDRYIDNSKDAAAYFKGYGSAIRKITRIKMHVDNPIYWNKELEYEWHELR